MRASKIIITAIIITGLFFSGCISNSTSKPTEPQTPIASPTPVSSQNTQSMEQTKINELENKINSMQQQINDLQTRLDMVGLPKPSNKNLIPNVPFRIEVKFGEWQTPTTWTFRENGQLEIREAGTTEFGTYKLLPNNNTIKMDSKKYLFYGIILYDNYATAIYDNGWIEWAREYKVFPPKYNPLTQKYELD